MHPKTIKFNYYLFFLSTFLFWLNLSSSTVINSEQSVKDNKILALSPVSTINLEREDQAKFDKTMEKARINQWYQLPISKIIQNLSLEFLDAKYEAGLLDQNSQEILVISLTKFDCVLFVETILALAKSISFQKYDTITFSDNLRNERYDKGIIDGYCSRLHYFSQWIANNEHKGYIKNITTQLGGIPLNKQLNFMSQHRASYPQLINNETNYQCIKQKEQELTQLQITYIPTNKVKSIYNQLQPGDIIGIVTQIPGLDTTHTGLIYQNESGNIGLIHASPAGKVTIASDVEYYVTHVPQAIGIMVARVSE